MLLRGIAEQQIPSREWQAEKQRQASSRIIFVEKGWGGVFLRENPPMLLMGFDLQAGYQALFVRFCCVFVASALEMALGRVWRPCCGHALAVATIFFHGVCSLVSLFHCALFGNNYERSWAGFVAGFVLCFVAFSGGAGRGGLDRAPGLVRLCGTHISKARCGAPAFASCSDLATRRF